MTLRLRSGTTAAVAAALPPVWALRLKRGARALRTALPRLLHWPVSLRPVPLSAFLASALLCALVLLPSTGGAFVPDEEQLWAFVRVGRPQITALIVETRNRVFDPAATATADQVTEFSAGESTAGMDTVPVEVPSRAFRQRIYWQAPAFLAVETLAEDGTLLHFYMEEGSEPISVSRDETRPFSLLDVWPAYLPFAGADPQAWRRGAMLWGLAPHDITLVHTSKERIIYQLAAPGAALGDGLWIQRDPLRLVRFSVRVPASGMTGSGKSGDPKTGSGAETTLTLEFGNFFLDDSVTLEGSDTPVYYPATSNYLLNGKLIRQTSTVSLQVNPTARDFPLNRLHQQAARLSPPAVITYAPPES